jgi:hypothetical protein
MMVAAGRGALSIADNPAMWISATAEKPMTSHFTRCARPPADRHRRSEANPPM